MAEWVSQPTLFLFRDFGKEEKLKEIYMRSCNLEKVPKILKMGKEACDWQNAVGLNIPFEYDGLKDSFKIVDFESRDKVYVIYKGKKYMLYGKYIRMGKIAKLFGQTIEWKYSKGDIIKDHVYSHDRNLLIIARKYIEENKNPNNRNHKYYQYKCLTCGYDCSMDDFWVNESDLKDGKGCGCCAGTKVVVGINDISTTLPWRFLTLMTLIMSIHILKLAIKKLK